MRPREPTWTFERAVLASLVWETDHRDPNAILGQLQLLDLDSGDRSTVSFVYPRADAATFERLAELKRCAYPEAKGRPPPELVVEVAIEFDRSLRLVRFRRREEYLAELVEKADRATAPLRGQVPLTADEAHALRDRLERKLSRED